jgi:hypothetical protein
MKWLRIFLLMLVLPQLLFCQLKREDIFTTVVLFPQREAFKKDLAERVIARTFDMVLDTNSEFKYETACWAVTQFLYTGPNVQKGFDKLFDQYEILAIDTKKSFLEAVYATYPGSYTASISRILEKEKDPALFAMCAVYLFRVDSSVNHGNSLKIKMTETFPGYDSIAVLVELERYINFHPAYLRMNTPSIPELFRWQQNGRQKTIYSFQRWNRNFPGLALVQLADGSFARDGSGELLLFEQLARSGSDLPYFIVNGSTPQGVYSIQGLGVSHDHLIGPTPNVQLLLPFEGKWEKFYHQPNGAVLDSLELYKQLLPPDWRNYESMKEAWNAGRIGRTEIIAHGTTIDPQYFRDKSFYPLTPTLGCLCAKELWNPASGRILVSDQFSLVSAFESSPGTTGYLFVINVDNQQKPVSRAEVEKWVREFESGNKK